MDRLVIFQREVDNLARDPHIQADLLVVGQKVAERAAALAPKKTGAGARSIHAEKEGNEVRVDWDEDHAYMLYPEYGTRFQRAQPFLRPAAMTPLQRNTPQ